MGSAAGVLRIPGVMGFTMEQIVRNILYLLAYAITPMFSSYCS